MPDGLDSHSARVVVVNELRDPKEVEAAMTIANGGGAKCNQDCVLIGRFSADFLTEVNSVIAPQPDVTEPDSQQKLKAEAARCRGALRWAQHLDRKRKRGDKDLSDQDTTLAQQL